MNFPLGRPRFRQVVVWSCSAAASSACSRGSIALVATTLGAVAGPNLVTPMGSIAVSLGIPALAGTFLLAALAYSAAGLVLLLLPRPDPFLLVAALVARKGDELEHGDTLSPAQPPRNSGVVVGASAVVVTQVAMVAIMTMTPVQMRTHGMSLAAVGAVIGVHIWFMYLPSLITGILVDKVGRLPGAIAAGITLLLAGVVAATAPIDGMVQLTVALALLGLGWNFGLISGTALVIDSTPTATRARIQGNLDVLIALAGAAGGALSGVVVAGSGFAALSLGGGVLSVLLIPVLILARVRRAPVDDVTRGL